MKIIFVSNYLNHHQSYFCDQLSKMVDSFFFIATNNNYTQGYQSHINSSYVLDFDFYKKECLALIEEADVCIFGGCPTELIEFRMKTSKTTLLYTERFFKRGSWRRLIPRTYKEIHRRTIRFKNKKFYILCAGAYVSDDLTKLNFPKEKCFKWGYFPKLILYNDMKELFLKKDPLLLIWCGRLLNWKHPEIALKIASALKKRGYLFKLKIVGEGPMFFDIQRKIKKYNLEDSVSLIGSLSTNSVRELMENAGICLVTSDKQEGWGVVLNEAMNSGCVVVANKAIGSAPYLIKDKSNGFLYKGNRTSEIIKIIEPLFRNTNLQKEVGKKAYYTIKEEWNYVTACSRLMDFLTFLADDTNDEYKNAASGPMSKV